MTNESTAVLLCDCKMGTCSSTSALGAAHHTRWTILLELSKWESLPARRGTNARMKMAINLLICSTRLSIITKMRMELFISMTWPRVEVEFSLLFVMNDYIGISIYLFIYFFQLYQVDLNFKLF